MERRKDFFNNDEKEHVEMKKVLAMILALLCGSAFAETAMPAPAQENQFALENIQELNGGNAKAYFQNDQLTFLEGACTAEPVKTTEAAAEVIASVNALLGCDENTHFEPWRILNDSFGNVYYVYQQTYADAVVLGGAVKVITDKDGNMLGLTSSVAAELPDKEELEMPVTAEQAEELVLRHEAEGNRPQPEIMAGMTQKIVLPVERELDIEADDVYTRFVWAVYTTNPSISVAAGSALPYLAHYVTLSGEYLYSLPTILPGDIVAQAGYDANYVFQFMEPADYTGYVDMEDGSEQEITVVLMCDTRTGMYYLGNIERKIIVADCWEFLYNGGSVKLEYSPDNLEWDQTGLKSLYNYCRAYDYYKAIGWEGADGEGTPIIILKDFCDQYHTPIDNAAYACKAYGWQCFLSSGINTYSEALDVIAHEFTHCVTGSVMTYNPYLNDFGAINEAVSDIQGNLCEMFYGATEDATWKIGEGSGSALRSMSDPHRYGQPEYSWDIYYKDNVNTPTDINDRGGVHTNSSLLNNVAYRLCADGGMTLEEARAFWFAVDCAMVPGTDYPQLRELLPWVLKNAGLDTYQAALKDAIAATRLGDDTVEALSENQALLTLNLPDTEIFNDGNWRLSVNSLNLNLLGEKVTDFLDKVNSGSLADYPRKLQELLTTPEPTPAPTPGPKKSIWEKVRDGIEKLLKKDTAEEETEKLDFASPEFDEVRDWLVKELQQVYFSDSASAGQDGHTIRMMAQPGRAVPCLMYMETEPGTMNLRQMNIVLYVNSRWVDMTQWLEILNDTGDDAGAAAKVNEFLNSDLFKEVVDSFLSGKGWQGLLEMFTLDIKGGEPYEIPNAGLENVDFTWNMAAKMKLTEEQTVENKKSRPKLPTAGELIEEMVVNYGAYGEEAEAQNDRLMMKLAAIDPVAAAKWESILRLWASVNNDLRVNIDALPDGLPDTDELCLVALGFQLNPDGTMKDELVERLRVLKKNAEKYPNALIVCTGGGTAAENENATEAGKMAEWLIQNGIDEKRIVVEDKSLTTAQNAIYTYDILTEKYPQVKQLAIVSSDYHIATGALLFGAEATLRADKAGTEKMKVVSNAAYAAPSGALSAMFQAGALIELSGDVVTAFEIYYDTYTIHELPPIK